MKSGSASLLGCTVHSIHTRLSVRIATYSGGCPLLEYINNVNKLCFLGSQPRGIILLGDSAGAHFHIPPEWLTASQMSLVSNSGSTHSGCAFVPCALNVKPTPNRCKFPFARDIHCYFRSRQMQAMGFSSSPSQPQPSSCQKKQRWQLRVKTAAGVQKEQLCVDLFWKAQAWGESFQHGCYP